jgi:hypothetical protein
MMLLWRWRNWEAMMAESNSTGNDCWVKKDRNGIEISRPGRILSPLAACLLTVSCFYGYGDLRADTSSLRVLQQPLSLKETQSRAKIQVDLEGTLLVELAAQPTSDQSSKRIPLKAKATQDYFESVAFQDGVPLAAARQYVTAKLENWVSGKSSVQNLREDCASTRILLHDGVWQQYCPTIPLERREVDLLHSPINTLALEKLLPVEPARLQSHWRISEEDARQLFNLEAVHRSELKARVLKVEKGVAKLEIDGNLQATVDRVPTEIRVRGSAHVELGSQGAFVSWLGVSIQEKREISKYRPGFEVTARLELIRKEQPNLQLASRNQLIDLASNDDPSRWLIRLESIPAKFQTVASRNWITYLDGGEDCVFRLVEDNQAIAQCNISQLPSLDAGTQITAEGLQLEIRQAMGDHFEEFIETTEKLTNTQLRLLRVEVAGTQEEVPIRWIYAHLSDDSGRRMALVFTLAAKYAERFAGEDLQLLESLVFTTGKNSAQQSDSQSAARPTAVR